MRVCACNPALKGTAVDDPCERFIIAVLDRLLQFSEDRVVDLELVKRGERAITALYLHDCVTAVPVAANAGYYARIVAERAAFRRLVQAGTRIAQLGYSGTGDIDTVLDELKSARKAVSTKRRA